MARKEREAKYAIRSVDEVCRVLLDKAGENKDNLAQISLDYFIVRTDLFEDTGLPKPKGIECQHRGPGPVSQGSPGGD